MRSGWQILDPVFLLRPTLMFPVWIFFLAGLWSAGQQPLPSESRTSASLWIGLSLTAVMGAVYILNQIQDVETDRINRKLFLISDGHVPVRSAYMEAALLVFASLFAGFQIEIRAGLLLLILFLLTGWTYSFPPAQFKNRPIASLIVNGGGGLLIASLGWVAGGGAGWIPLQSIVYFFACAAVSFNTMLPDIEGDRTAGKITFAVRFGLRVTAIWALGTESVTVILAWIFREWIVFYPALAMLPFFIYALTRKEISEVVRATKYSVLTMAIAICIVYPWFLIPVFVVFFGSRLYYKARFGLDYPSLKNS
jgi:4-hydroxybenzoate polyprenyltransferase